MDQAGLGGSPHKQWTGGCAWELGQCPLGARNGVFPGAGLSLEPHPTIHLHGDAGSTADSASSACAVPKGEAGLLLSLWL